MAEGKGAGKDRPPPRYRRDTLDEPTAMKCRWCKGQVVAALYVDQLEGGRTAFYHCPRCDRGPEGAAV